MAKFSQLFNLWRRKKILFLLTNIMSCFSISQVYNEMIKRVPFLKDSIESRWELTLSFLSQMNQTGTPPNLQTFNAVLEVLAKIAMWKRARPLALSVLAEMKRCGVAASLASYHHLLHIFCRERGPISHILLDIVHELAQNDSLTMRDPSDSLFFVTAMETAQRHLQDSTAAKKVHDLLMKGNNSTFLTDAMKDTHFYSSFLKVLVAGESVEEFFRLYDEIVPMTAIPDSFLIMEMVKYVNPQNWRHTFSLSIFLSYSYFGFHFRRFYLYKAFNLFNLFLDHSKSTIRLIDWLIDWLDSDCWFDRLIDWLIDWLVIDLLVSGCWTDWLIDWS